jgi:DNA polymerase-4
MNNIFLAPQNRRILFLDMNAFFAQCEQQANPALRGRPVGVAPYTGETGCIIAASYEAKRQGIKTGTLVWKARQLVPDIIIVEPDTAKYRAIHHAITAILDSYGPFRALSIDEMAMPLWPNERRHALEIARSIKNDLRVAIGQHLTCSIGIGPNQFYAKLATDLEKPDGLVEITMEEARHVLGRLKLTDLPGIGRGMERRLFALRIFNPAIFFDAPIEYLRQGLGILGDYWYLRLHGFLLDEGEFTRQSLGHSHVLEPYLRIPHRAQKVLQKLVERTGSRLRKNNLWARGVALSIDYLPDLHWHESRRTEIFQDSLTFWEEVKALWQKCPYKNFPPLRLAVTCLDVVKLQAKPVSLFMVARDRQALAWAQDTINDKYGAFTLAPASLMEVKRAAPDRIPFGRV